MKRKKIIAIRSYLLPTYNRWGKREKKAVLRLILSYVKLRSAKVDKASDSGEARDGKRRGRRRRMKSLQPLGVPFQKPQSPTHYRRWFLSLWRCQVRILVLRPHCYFYKLRLLLLFRFFFSVRDQKKKKIERVEVIKGKIKLSRRRCCCSTPASPTYTTPRLAYLQVCI